jgi:hypothetical protein
MLRTMCLVLWLALPAGLVLVGQGSAAAQDAPDARQACAPDAMRLCSDFIPDVPKITKCMIRKYRQLSQECRVAMAHGHRAYRHRRYKSHT